MLDNKPPEGNEQVMGHQGRLFIIGFDQSVLHLSKKIVLAIINCSLDLIYLALNDQIQKLPATCLRRI